MVAEALDDVGVGDPVEKPVVDVVADGLGQAGDLAVGAAVSEGGCRFRRGGLDFGGGDMGIGVHGGEKTLRFTQIWSDLLRCTQGRRTPAGGAVGSC